MDEDLDALDFEDSKLEPDDLRVTTEVHPGTYRGRVSLDMHRVIPEGEDGEEDVNEEQDDHISAMASSATAGFASSAMASSATAFASSATASTMSAPPSPRHRQLQTRHRPRTMSMSSVTSASTFASSASPFASSASPFASSASSQQQALVPSSTMTSLSLMDFEQFEQTLPDHIPEDVLSRILKDLDQYVTSLASISNLTDLTSQWMSIRNRIYSLSSHYLPLVMDINVEYERLIATVIRLQLKFMENHLIERQSGATQSEKSRAYINRFARLYNIIYNVRTMLFSFTQNQAIANPDKPYEMGHFFDYVNPGHFSFLLFEKLKPDLDFIIYVLDTAAQRRLRKQWRDCPQVGGLTVCLYEEIRTPDGHPTHAWQRTTYLEEFIHTLIQPETHGRQWHQFMESRGVMSALKNYLQFSNDVRLPFVKRQRHIFSFLNGVYDADRQAFFPYDHPLPSSVVAAKYFPQPFDMSILNPDLDPSQIPTPPLTKLFDSQNIPPAAQNVICALIGRLFHELNKHERWQIALFVLGQPETGKSTLSGFFHELFDGEDVGTLDSDMEKQFGLSAFMDTFLAICEEVSERFTLTHTKLQSMIDGHHVNVAKKYQSASQVLWKPHVVLNANVVPPHWNEYGGNLVRRLVCVLFNNFIENIETNLDKKLLEWMPNIIHKCNISYRRLASEWNQRSFWNPDTPDYFVKNRQYLGGIISPIQAFIQLSDYVEVTQDTNDTMKLREFIRALNQFCDERGYPRKKWNTQLWTPTFRRLGIVQCLGMLHKIKSTQEWFQSQQSGFGGGMGGGGRPFQSNSVPFTQGD